MKEKQISRIWNNKADGYNQWDALGTDEKVEFAYNMGARCVLGYLVEGGVISEDGAHYKSVIAIVGKPPITT